MKWMHSDYAPIVVYCGKCDDWMAEGDTKFESIQEDFQGRDLLTFKCPSCKTSQESYRVGKG